MCKKSKIRCGGLICLVSFVLVLGLANNASSQPTGEVLIEWWLDISGASVAYLTGNENYPDNPDGSGTLKVLELPQQVDLKPPELFVLEGADNFGVRIQGLLWPPATGDYTFWITGDNGSQFWLSTEFRTWSASSDPANVVMMCEVPGGQWTGARQWAKFPDDQKSDAVTLRGDRAYYFDVLFKEGDGEEGVAIGWAGPTIGTGDVPNVIEGKYLSFPAAPNYSNAFNLSPADGATDVPRDVVFSWEPGEFAAPTNGHKVYLGESFDDVNDATGAVAQTAASYAPSPRLDFSTSYYWRVDEVNTPPFSHIESKGEVRSFTTEPVAYPIAGENITATASSQSENQGPENTVNGSGLDVNDLDLHSTELTDMWISNIAGPQPTWIEYELDKVYKLHEMWVWNHNTLTEPVIGFGAKEATIEYSLDGANWTILGTTHEFARAPGTSGYAHNTTIDFGGVAAKYLRLTANSNWGGVLPQYGLSEVSFTYIPVRAREPQPESGATDTDVDVTLSWRAGREVVSHDVYISTDEQAVIDSNVPVSTVTEAQDGPLSLDLGQTYYWKVNEVNEAETPTMLEGEIWNFSTPEFFIVDDFELYNDIPDGEEGSNLVYNTWIDGYEDTSNGSTIGYVEAFQPSMETVTVHGGDQAMPFFYSNTGGAAYSEAERTFAVPQNWTKAAVQTLVLYFHGSPGNTGQLYVKVNGVKVVYDGDAADIAKIRWIQWNIDLASLGVNLQDVTTLAIGIDDNGAVGTLYFDDIGVYESAPAAPSEEYWIEAEAADTITLPFMVYDDPDASGGQYIMKDPDHPGTGFEGPIDPDGTASYTFTVEGGTYTIAGRVQEGPSGPGYFGFWFLISGATVNQTPFGPDDWGLWGQAASVWSWLDIRNYNAPVGPIQFTMDPGTYTLKIGIANPAELDALVITRID